MSLSTRPALAAALLLVTSSVAWCQDLPWNPYHGKRPISKPQIDSTRFLPLPTEGQGEQAARDPGDSQIAARRYGLRSTPPIPGSWLDKQEYPSGPYGTRIVRAVVSGEVLRAAPLPIEVKLRDQLEYWERCLIGVDDAIRIGRERMSYLQERALRYVSEHPEVIGHEITLRF